MKIWSWILLGVVLGMGVVQPVLAESPTPAPSDDAVNTVAKQMYCPVCENIPLDVCPTKACKQWRELIREKLAAGWSEQQIKDYFVRQYGDRVLSEPPRRGLNWLVYLLPPLVMILGAYLVYRVLVGARKPETVTISPDNDAAQQPALDGISAEDAVTIAPRDGVVSEPDAYVKQIEEDLKKRTK